MKFQQYSDIVSHIMTDMSTETWDAIHAPDPRFLCCKDFMYDWENGTVIPHRSDFYRMSVLDCRAEDIGNCSGVHWEAFLDNLTGGDDALRQRILEMIGVIITGYPCKAFFLLRGESGTGKRQLMNFLRNLLGKSSCFALNDISQLGDKYTTDCLCGKLLCLCGDMPDGPLNSRTIGTIKQLTGDDLIRAEPKYKTPYNFENTAKLLFASNYPLRIANPDREEAFLNRLITIPCRNPVPKERQIEGLHRFLLEEAGYIIEEALDTLRKFQARNGEFTPISLTLEEESVQLPENDRQIIEFIQECCEFTPGEVVPVGTVYQEFQDYVPESDLDNAQFSKRLLKLFPKIKTSRTSKTRNYMGIRLIFQV